MVDHEKQLNDLVSKEYQEPFRHEFFSRLRQHYFKECYRIPLYGTYQTLERLACAIPTHPTLKYMVKHIESHIKDNGINYTTFYEQYKYIKS